MSLDLINDIVNKIKESDFVNNFMEENKKKLANVNPNVEQHIMINNSAYRKEVNSILASFGVYVLVDELLDVDLKSVFVKIFPKNEKTNS